MVASALPGEWTEWPRAAECDLRPGARPHDRLRGESRVPIPGLWGAGAFAVGAVGVVTDHVPARLSLGDLRPGAGPHARVRWTRYPPDEQRPGRAAVHRRSGHGA